MHIMRTHTYANLYIHASAVHTLSPYVYVYTYIHVMCRVWLPERNTMAHTIVLHPFCDLGLGDLFPKLPLTHVIFEMSRLCTTLATTCDEKASAESE